MARRDTRPDPKEAALAGARCLNPHPEQVTDPEFGASDFLDARDAVQVKYEMVRKVRRRRSPRPPRRSATPAPRTTPRPPHWSPPGWTGLCPRGPGRAGPASSPRKSSPGPRSSSPPGPGLRPAQLPDRIADAFGVRVHPRSVERALARRRERHSKSR